MRLSIDMTSIHCLHKQPTHWQGLAAASKTVEFMKLVHSLHAYFLLSGDTNSKDFNLNMLLLASTLLFSSESSLAVPIIYEVSRLRDGNNFATRRVDARQKGKIIFTLFASFQVFIMNHHEILAL